MDYTVSEWMNLALRWMHVFAAILWIGQTYFFSWLDGRFSEHAPDGEGRDAEVWLVHSGGYYAVRKEPLRAGVASRLRWFRWEAAFTWITGVLLLGVVYHMGGLLVDAGSDVSAGIAATAGVAAIVLGWAVYDAIWQSKLGQREAAAVAICFLLLVAVAWGLSQVMSGRSAYMHVGAMLGTIMTANVWMRILPTQRRTIAAVESGQPFDPAPGARAKQRTKHNTFMVVPVVFIMISNHFPVSTYGHTYNWLILAALTLVGWGAAAAMKGR